MRRAPARLRAAPHLAKADQTPEAPFEEGVNDQLSADLRHRMISEAAYHLYAQRGFRDGYDLDDWLEAEARIDHLLVAPPETDADTDSL